MGWQKFEENVYKFLKNTLDIKNLTLDHKGGSDSTTSDIKFSVNNSQKFILEVKKNIAQAGQFVVVGNVKNKKYSVSAKTVCTLETKSIITHMNNNNYYRLEEKKFENAPKGKKEAIELICDKKLMYKRVIAQMKTKSYFIASSHHDKDSNFSKENPLIIEKIDDLENYFDITGTYRPKWSGSAPLPIPKYEDVKKIFKCKEEGNRLYVIDQNNQYQKYWTEKLTPTTDRFDAHLYLSKPIKNDLREVKKLSTTYNSNVIFTLKLKEKNKLDHTDLENVINALNVP